MVEQRADEQAERFEEIRRRRPELFKCLPVSSNNDLVHGSWWIVGASLFATLIPIFPIISLYIERKFWPTFGEDVMTTPSHLAAFVLLAVGMGIFFVFGSLLFVRSFWRPHLRPILPENTCCPNDEVHAMWWFTIGTSLTIPVTAIYVYYFRDSHEFFAALFICCMGTLATFIATFLFFPKGYCSVCQSMDWAKGAKSQSTEIISPLLHAHCSCFRPGSAYHIHVKTDWLIINWLAFYATLMGIVGSVVVFAWYANKRDNKGMYDYATGFFDLVLLLVGNIYYLAGSYYEMDKHEQAEEGALEMVDPYSPAAGVQTTQPVSSDFVSQSAPVALPSGWETAVDRETGTTYYYHSGSGVAQWRPPVVKAGGEMVTAPDKIPPPNDAAKVV